MNPMQKTVLKSEIISKSYMFIGTDFLAGGRVRFARIGVSNAAFCMLATTPSYQLGPTLGLVVKLSCLNLSPHLGGKKEKNDRKKQLCPRNPSA